MPWKVLYVEGCRDGTVGGSHVSLFSMVANLDRSRYQPVVVFYSEHHVSAKLRALNVEVHVLENRHPFDFGHRFLRWSTALTMLGYVVLPLQKLANFVWFFLRPVLRSALFLRRNAIALVHLNNSSSGNHEWMLASLLVGVPYVSHERGMGAHLSASSRWLGGAAAAVVCVSSWIREGLVRQGLRPERTVVVHNGIDPTQVCPVEDPVKLRARFGARQDDLVIGVIGNVKRWKGQETVIRATELLKKRWPRIRCLLVGDVNWDDPYCAGLHTLVEKLALRENVIFVGFTEHPADYINAMDVIVHSSIEPEPFGRVIIEAMYLGKPVVATNIGGPTEILDDGHDGLLVDAGDELLLAQRITWLLEAEGKAQYIGQNARRKVMKQFTIYSAARQIQSTYEQILVQ